MTIKTMLQTAAASGLTFSVGADGEIDYKGSSVSKAMEALDACDELDLVIFEHRAGKDYRIGSAFYVRNEPSADDIDNIADAGGWINTWMDENVDY